MLTTALLAFSQRDAATTRQKSEDKWFGVWLVGYFLSPLVFLADLARHLIASRRLLIFFIGGAGTFLAGIAVFLACQR
jgi:hypothetical protein